MGNAFCLSPFAEAALANKNAYIERLSKKRVPGLSFQHAPNEYRSDRYVILEACKLDGASLQFADKTLRDDPSVVLVACRKDGFALDYASERLRDDKEFVLEVCRVSNGWGLFSASKRLQNDKDVVQVACQQNGNVLKHITSSQLLHNDKDIVLAACNQCGSVLQYAPAALRADKDVVLAAAASDREALKFALNGLNQDRDCLIAAGLWDPDYQQSLPSTPLEVMDLPSTTRKIVLSTRFALAPNSSSKATQFAVLLKNHPYIQPNNFVVYSPNAFDKDTCDPQWTRFDWPCRGTFETCQKDPPALRIGVPQPESCWRYSFRFQLQQAKECLGFMIQLVEVAGVDGFTYGASQRLGDGQTIEREMAQELGIKIFRVPVPFQNHGGKYEYERDFTEKEIDVVVSNIREWYEGNCEDMSECDIQFNVITWKRRRMQSRYLSTPDTNQLQVYRHDREFGFPIILENTPDKSGYSISSSHNGFTIAIAADYGLGSESLGRVQTFRYGGGDWSRMGSAVEGSFDWKGNDFGIQVSLSSDGYTMAIAALGAFRIGGAAVFSYNGVDWYQVGNDLKGDGGGDVINTISLSDDGKRVAIVSTGRDDSYIYTYELSQEDKTNNWVQVGEKLHGEECSQQEFANASVLQSAKDRTLLAVRSSAKILDRREILRRHAPGLFKELEGGAR